MAAASGSCCDGFPIAMELGTAFGVALVEANFPVAAGL
jgi:hypothetical protein